MLILFPSARKLGNFVWSRADDASSRLRRLVIFWGKEKSDCLRKQTDNPFFFLNPLNEMF